MLQSDQSIFYFMRLRLLFCSALLSLLYGCSSLPDGPERRVDLPEQLQALQQVNKWKIQGKMALRANEQAISATLVWRNSPEAFHFRLTNLLGITLINMRYADGVASLEADGETYTHADPQALIKQTTGWDLPVNQLLNWVKGLPGATDNYTLNNKDLLATLVPGDCTGCGNWEVSYANYGLVGETWLPHSLLLTDIKQPNTFIKFRIDRWTLL